VLYNDLVVVFWFYKELDLCLERIKHFKQFNPNLTIYGLYGGVDIDESLLEDIRQEVKHIYIYKEKKSSRWKWLNGDQMLVDWFRNTGVNFEWQKVFILQWDIVMFKPLDYFIHGIEKDQFALSSFRNIKHVQDWWPHYEPDKISEFELYLKENIKFNGDLSCCLFVFALLPREFFEYFKEKEYPGKYFLEYKIPSVLSALGFKPYKSEKFDAFWDKEPSTTYTPIEERNLLAVGHGISNEVIKKNLVENKNMIFHPCYTSLKNIDINDVKFTYVNMLSLAKTNIIEFFKFTIKRIIKYNRKKRTGLLKLIK
jgi:hypothetical protein